MSKTNLWRNKETLSVYNCIENDPNTREIARLTIYKFGKEVLKDFCYRLWPDGRTWENQKLSKVDWKELQEFYEKEVFGIEKKYELFP